MRESQLLLSIQKNLSAGGEAQRGMIEPTFETGLVRAPLARSRLYAQVSRRDGSGRGREERPDE